MATVFSGCIEEKSQGTKEVRLAGPDMVMPFSRVCAELFNEKYDDFEVAVIEREIGDDEEEPREADIAVYTRELEEGIIAHGVNVVDHVVAKRVVAVVVSEEIYNAGVSTLTSEQLRRIYLPASASQKITNWKEVGGPDREIEVLGVKEGRDARAIFIEEIFGSGSAEIGVNTICPLEDDISFKVKSSNKAIGYGALGLFSDSFSDPGWSIIKVDDIGCTPENITNDRYPLTRKLHLYTSGKTNDAINKFIEFVQKEGEGIIDQQGFPTLATEEWLGPSRTPIQIHLTWQNDPKTTMAITWMTTDKSPSIVEYGLTPDYNDRVEGKSYRLTAGRGRIIYEVELTGLEPATTYHYRCGDGEIWSEDHTFRTGVLPRQNFTFAVYGDSRTNDTARRMVKDAVKKMNPAFSLQSGDLIEDGPSQKQWDLWFETMEDLISDSPCMPCIGNHDIWLPGAGLATTYCEHFALPGNEMWYSFDYGPVHFIILNCERRVGITKGTGQYEWLEKALKEAENKPNILWKMVMYHRPSYSSGPHGNDTLTRKHWCPLFDKYGVDFVWNGHDHIYERTYPIYRKKVVNRSNNSYYTPNGTIYIVSGGAGAPLYESKGGDWVVHHEDVYHFCEVEVLSNKTIHITARYTNGESFDEFWVSKEK